MNRPNREGVHAEGFIPSPCLLGHGVRVVKDLFLTVHCAEEFVAHVIVVVSRCNNNPIEEVFGWRMLGMAPVTNVTTSGTAVSRGTRDGRGNHVLAH